MEDKIILNNTELTGIIGKNEMEKLSNFLDKEKWKSYRKKYDEAANLKKHDFPIQLDFELNSSCNLKCPMCPISAESPKGKGKKTWFDFDFFKEIIDYASEKGTRSIKLNYINEPLIRRDIIKFIEYAKSKKIIDIYFSTNGILLNDDLSKQLILSGLTRIQISIDAVSQKTYEKVRPGGDLNKVIRNLKRFLEIKKKLKKTIPLVSVNFVKTPLNEFELNEFLKSWEGVVDMIGIQEFIKPTKVKDKMISKKTLDKKNFKCSFPYKQLVINNEKDILPCCTFWGEELAIQKIEKPEDLSKAWNSEKMKYLREKHFNGEYNDTVQCKNCVHGGVE